MHDGDRLLRSAFDDAPPPPPPADPQGEHSDDGTNEPHVLLWAGVLSLAVGLVGLLGTATWTVAFFLTAVLHFATGATGDVSRRPADVIEGLVVGGLAWVLLFREFGRRLGWRDRR